MRKKEERKQYDKEYRDSNKEKLSLKFAVYYQENKEEKLMKAAEYRKSLDKEKQREYMKEYRAKNLERLKLATAERNRTTVLYSKHKDDLTVDDRATEGENGILQVACWYCGKVFAPTKMQVRAREQALKGQGAGEIRMYCSDGCKTACPTYNQRKAPRGALEGTSREMQPTFRKKVLERDGWECQRCGSTDKQLHAHHILPHSLTYDSMHVDNGLTLCVDCHAEVHRQDGCQQSIMFKSSMCADRGAAQL